MDVRRIKKIPAKVISYFENEKIPFWYYIATFFAVIIIRQLLESFSQKDKVFDFYSYVAYENTQHFTLAYIAVAMMLVIFIHYVTAESVARVCRVLLPGMILLFIAPLIDLVMTGGSGVNISYLQPGVNADLWRTYFTIGDGYSGFSTGMIAEVRIIVFCYFLYFFAKKCGIILSMLWAWCCYTLIYIWGLSPYIVTGVLANLGFSGRLNEVLMTKFFLFVVFFLSTWFFYLADRKLFMSVIMNLQIAKVVYYLLSVLFGAALAATAINLTLSGVIYQDQTTPINIIYALMSVSYAAVFASMMRLIADAGNDKYSVAADTDVSVLKFIAALMLVLALFYASFADAKIFLLMAGFISIMFLYHVPPFQFKRGRLISKFTMSCAALILVFLGFIIVAEASGAFPPQLTAIYLAGMTLATINSGFWKLGSERASCIISGVIGFIVSLSFYFVLRDIRVLPALAGAGILFFYLVNKSGNQKNKIIWLADAGLLAMTTYLLW